MIEYGIRIVGAYQGSVEDLIEELKDLNPKTQALLLASYLCAEIQPPVQRDKNPYTMSELEELLPGLVMLFRETGDDKSSEEYLRVQAVTTAITCLQRASVQAVRNPNSLSVYFRGRAADASSANADFFETPQGKALKESLQNISETITGRLKFEELDDLDDGPKH